MWAVKSKQKYDFSFFFIFSDFLSDFSDFLIFFGFSYFLRISFGSLSDLFRISFRFFLKKLWKIMFISDFWTWKNTVVWDLGGTCGGRTFGMWADLVVGERVVMRLQNWVFCMCVGTHFCKNECNLVIKLCKIKTKTCVPHGYTFWWFLIKC